VTIKSLKQTISRGVVLMKPVLVNGFAGVLKVRSHCPLVSDASWSNTLQLVA